MTAIVLFAATLMHTICIEVKIVWFRVRSSVVFSLLRDMRQRLTGRESEQRLLNLR